MAKILTNSGNLVSDVFRVAVSMGKIPGWRSFRKFGMNNDVPATGSEELWPVGTARVLPAAAGVATLSSDSVADDADPAGTGAWTVTIEGLNASYAEIKETVSLNGTTGVTTTASFLRINRMYVATAGTGRVNAGNITATIGGNTQAYIEASEGQTHQTHYTVPAGHVVVVTGFMLVVGRMTGSTDCEIQSQILPDYSTDAAWRSVDDQYTFGPSVIREEDIAFLLQAKTEVRQVITSTSTTQVSGQWQGYLVDTNRYPINAENL